MTCRCISIDSNGVGFHGTFDAVRCRVEAHVREQEAFLSYFFPAQSSSRAKVTEIRIVGMASMVNNGDVHQPAWGRGYVTVPVTVVPCQNCSSQLIATAAATPPTEPSSASKKSMIGQMLSMFGGHTGDGDAPTAEISTKKTPPSLANLLNQLFMADKVAVCEVTLQAMPEEPNITSSTSTISDALMITPDPLYRFNGKSVVDSRGVSSGPVKIACQTVLEVKVEASLSPAGQSVGLLLLKAPSSLTCSTSHDRTAGGLISRSRILNAGGGVDRVHGRGLGAVPVQAVALSRGGRTLTPAGDESGNESADSSYKERSLVSGSVPRDHGYGYAGAGVSADGTGGAVSRTSHSQSSKQGQQDRGQAGHQSSKRGGVGRQSGGGSGRSLHAEDNSSAERSRLSSSSTGKPVSGTGGVLTVTPTSLNGTSAAPNKVDSLDNKTARDGIASAAAVDARGRSRLALSGSGGGNSGGSGGGDRRVLPRGKRSMMIANELANINKRKSLSLSIGIASGSSMQASESSSSSSSSSGGFNESASSIGGGKNVLIGSTTAGDTGAVGIAVTSASGSSGAAASTSNNPANKRQRISMKEMLKSASANGNISLEESLSAVDPDFQAQFPTSRFQRNKSSSSSSSSSSYSYSKAYSFSAPNGSSSGSTIPAEASHGTAVVAGTAVSTFSTPGESNFSSFVDSHHSEEADTQLLSTNSTEKMMTRPSSSPSASTQLQQQQLRRSVRGKGSATAAVENTTPSNGTSLTPSTAPQSASAVKPGGGGAGAAAAAAAHRGGSTSLTVSQFEYPSSSSVDPSNDDPSDPPVQYWFSYSEKGSDAENISPGNIPGITPGIIPGAALGEQGEYDQQYDEAHDTRCGYEEGYSHNDAATQGAGSFAEEGGVAAGVDFSDYRYPGYHDGGYHHNVTTTDFLDSYSRDSAARVNIDENSRSILFPHLPTDGSSRMSALPWQPQSDSLQFPISPTSASASNLSNAATAAAPLQLGVRSFSASNDGISSNGNSNSYASNSNPGNSRLSATSAGSAGSAVSGTGSAASVKSMKSPSMFSSLFSSFMTNAILPLSMQTQREAPVVANTTNNTDTAAVAQLTMDTTDNGDNSNISASAAVAAATTGYGAFVTVDEALRYVASSTMSPMRRIEEASNSLMLSPEPGAAAVAAVPEPEPRKSSRLSVSSSSSSRRGVVRSRAEEEEVEDTIFTNLQRGFGPPTASSNVDRSTAASSAASSPIGAGSSEGVRRSSRRHSSAQSPSSASVPAVVPGSVCGVLRGKSLLATVMSGADEVRKKPAIVPVSSKKSSSNDTFKGATNAAPDCNTFPVSSNSSEEPVLSSSLYDTEAAAALVPVSLAPSKEQQQLIASSSSSSSSSSSATATATAAAISAAEEEAAAGPPIADEKLAEMLDELKSWSTISNDIKVLVQRCLIGEIYITEAVAEIITLVEMDDRKNTTRNKDEGGKSSTTGTNTSTGTTSTSTTTGTGTTKKGKPPKSQKGQGQEEDSSSTSHRLTSLLTKLTKHRFSNSRLAARAISASCLLLVRLQLELLSSSSSSTSSSSSSSAASASASTSVTLTLPTSAAAAKQQQDAVADTATAVDGGSRGKNGNGKVKAVLSAKKKEEKIISTAIGKLALSVSAPGMQNEDLEWLLERGAPLAAGLHVAGKDKTVSDGNSVSIRGVSTSTTSTSTATTSATTAAGVAALKAAVGGGRTAAASNSTGGSGTGTGNSSGTGSILSSPMGPTDYVAMLIAKIRDKYDAVAGELLSQLAAEYRMSGSKRRSAGGGGGAGVLNIGDGGCLLSPGGTNLITAGDGMIPDTPDVASLRPVKRSRREAKEIEEAIQAKRAREAAVKNPKGKFTIHTASGGAVPAVAATAVSSTSSSSSSSVIAAPVADKKKKKKAGKAGESASETQEREEREAEESMVVDESVGGLTNSAGEKGEKGEKEKDTSSGKGLKRTNTLISTRRHSVGHRVGMKSKLIANENNNNNNNTFAVPVGIPPNGSKGDKKVNADRRASSMIQGAAAGAAGAVSGDNWLRDITSGSSSEAQKPPTGASARNLLSRVQSLDTRFDKPGAARCNSRLSYGGGGSGAHAQQGSSSHFLGNTNNRSIVSDTSLDDYRMRLTTRLRLGGSPATGTRSAIRRGGGGIGIGLPAGGIGTTTSSIGIGMSSGLEVVGDTPMHLNVVPNSQEDASDIGSPTNNTNNNNSILQMRDFWSSETSSSPAGHSGARATADELFSHSQGHYHYQYPQQVRGITSRELMDSPKPMHDTLVTNSDDGFSPEAGTGAGASAGGAMSSGGRGKGGYRPLFKSFDDAEMVVGNNPIIMASLGDRESSWGGRSSAGSCGSGSGTKKCSTKQSVRRLSSWPPISTTSSNPLQTDTDTELDSGLPDSVRSDGGIGVTTGSGGIFSFRGARGRGGRFGSATKRSLPPPIPATATTRHDEDVTAAAAAGAYLYASSDTETEPDDDEVPDSAIAAVTRHRRSSANTAAAAGDGSGNRAQSSDHLRRHPASSLGASPVPADEHKNNTTTWNSHSGSGMIRRRSLLSSPASSPSPKRTDRRDREDLMRETTSTEPLASTASTATSTASHRTGGGKTGSVSVGIGSSSSSSSSSRAANSTRSAAGAGSGAEREKDNGGGVSESNSSSTSTSSVGASTPFLSTAAVDAGAVDDLTAASSSAKSKPGRRPMPIASRAASTASKAKPSATSASPVASAPTTTIGTIERRMSLRQRSPHSDAKKTDTRN